LPPERDYAGKNGVSEVPKKPVLLHYYITNRCNARCRFCNIWSEHPKKNAEIRDVLENLVTARKAGCRFVDFTGGEPLLHPDLPEFLAAAKKIGFITSVTTNCILFPDRAAELKGKIDLLHFSIDAAGAELHDSIRGCTSFDHVLESIPLALQNSMVPDLLYTYTDYNIHDMEGVYGIAVKHRLILILDPVFDTTGRDTTSAATHRKAVVFSRKSGVYLNRAHLTLRNKGGNHIRNPLCKAVTSTIVVSPDNQRLLPCFHHQTIRVPLKSESGKSIKEIAFAQKMEGMYSFCEGCHINCYFDPSYNYMLNRLFFQSLTAKFSYIIMKYVVYAHFKSLFRLF
jgi:MoaA/NifB/PqqE/SkfB family radical SAM enzyme